MNNINYIFCSLSPHSSSSITQSNTKSCHIYILLYYLLFIARSACRDHQSTSINHREIHTKFISCFAQLTSAMNIRLAVELIHEQHLFVQFIHCWRMPAELHDFIDACAFHLLFIICCLSLVDLLLLNGIKVAMNYLKCSMSR